MHLGAICRTPNEKTSAGSPYGRSDSTSGARYRAEPMQAVGRGDPSLSSRAVPKSQSLHLRRSVEIWNGDRNGDRWRFGWRSVEIWMEIRRSWDGDRDGDRGRSVSSPPPRLAINSNQWHTEWQSSGTLMAINGTEWESSGMSSPPRVKRTVCARRREHWVA